MASLFRRQMVRDASEYLEVTERELFSIAALYKYGAEDAEIVAKHRYMQFDSTGTIPDWIEGFFLDLLSGKIQDLVISGNHNISGDPDI